MDIVLEAEWRRLPDKDKAAALPHTLDQLAEYHTVILGDVSPKMLDSAFVDLLVKAVRERGVGLIVEAGPLYMPHKFDDRLDALLPVRLKRGAPGQMPKGVPSFHIELAPEGELHDAMRLYDDLTSNQNGWAQMPPYYWCAAAEKASPGATVLAWNPVAERGRRQDAVDRPGLCRPGPGVVRRHRFDVAVAAERRRPLLLQVLGPGHSRRRPQRQDDAEEELAGSAAGSRPAGRSGSGRVDGLRRRRLAAPRADADRAAADRRRDRRGRYDRRPNVKGRYTGKFTPKNSGEYRLTYTPDGQLAGGSDVAGGGGAGRVETAEPQPRRPGATGRRFARQARSSCTIWLRWRDELKDETTQIQRSPPPASLWDNWLTLTALVVLYSLDVGLRRLRGLS